MTYVKIINHTKQTQNTILSVKVIKNDGINSKKTLNKKKQKRLFQ